MGGYMYKIRIAMAAIWFYIYSFIRTYTVSFSSSLLFPSLALSPSTPFLPPLPIIITNPNPTPTFHPSPLLLIQSALRSGIGEEKNQSKDLPPPTSSPSLRFFPFHPSTPLSQGVK